MAAGAVPVTTGTATPWIVLKCQFADDTSTLIATQVLNDLFTTSGTGGMVDYWRDMSGGNVDLSGSTVAGWFRMSLTLADARKMTGAADPQRGHARHRRGLRAD
jgi:hypothetical protein